MLSKLVWRYGAALVSCRVFRDSRDYDGLLGVYGWRQSDTRMGGANFQSSTTVGNLDYDKLVRRMRWESIVVRVREGVAH